MFKQRLMVLGSAALLSVAMAGPGISGSTIGGNPTNGGGTTFSAPATTFVQVFGGDSGASIRAALQSNNPAQVQTAVLAAIATTFPAGIETIKLTVPAGVAPAGIAANLTNFVQRFAAASGLPLNSPAVLQLMTIAQSVSN